MKKQSAIIAILAIAIILLASGIYFLMAYKNKQSQTVQTNTNDQSSPTIQMANPASVNCVKLGGTLVMQKRGDGGEYGLCFFEDNRACEEWTLFNNDCPVGGVKTTGYDTDAQKFCAWSGGQTFADANAVCTFSDGSTCLDDDFYNGTCSRGMVDKTAEKCELETCHGLDVTCGSNPPDVCTAMYGLGDKCLQYVKCGVQDGKCQLLENNDFTQCKSCVENCQKNYSNDNIKVFECESNCK